MGGTPSQGAPASTTPFSGVSLLGGGNEGPPFYHHLGTGEGHMQVTKGSRVARPDPKGWSHVKARVSGGEGTPKPVHSLLFPLHLPSQILPGFQKRKRRIKLLRPLLESLKHIICAPLPPPSTGFLTCAAVATPWALDCLHCKFVQGPSVCQFPLPACSS